MEWRIWRYDGGAYQTATNVHNTSASPSSSPIHSHFNFMFLFFFFFACLPARLPARVPGFAYAMPSACLSVLFEVQMKNLCFRIWMISFFFSFAILPIPLAPPAPSPANPMPFRWDVWNNVYTFTFVKEWIWNLFWHRSDSICFMPADQSQSPCQPQSPSARCHSPMELMELMPLP